MTKVLIPLAQGCEELEAITLVDLLRRAGIDVTTASLTDNLQIIASRQSVLVANCLLDEALNDSFDMLILPGGQPGTNNLNADQRIHDLLLQYNTKQKYIGAICAAPMVLADAGILNGKTATAYPGVLKNDIWPAITISNDAIVQDGHILTSRGPGTAMDFALAIIEVLIGNQKRTEVSIGLARL